MSSDALAVRRNPTERYRREDSFSPREDSFWPDRIFPRRGSPTERYETNAARTAADHQTGCGVADVLAGKIPELSMLLGAF